MDVRDWDFELLNYFATILQQNGLHRDEDCSVLCATHKAETWFGFNYLQFMGPYSKCSELALTQMTAEVVKDEEYLSAISCKMRVRGALVGIESFTEEGLEAAKKLWNPVGQEMTAAIQTIQEHRIIVLSSVICGLECDTVSTLRTMRKFTVESKSLMAQFTVYRPYPGTKDYFEMMSDLRNQERPDYAPKHKTQILYDKLNQEIGVEA